MASLEGKKIKDTYKSLLKVNDNGELEVTGQEITDGAGNGTGVSLNTSGDLSATGTVSFGSLKDSGEDITITKFVDEADGIANNDDDTSIPTSAAVKDYVDNNITAQDLDITDGTNTGAVDLDSQSLTFTGDAGVSATVSGQEVSFDSSALQAQITSNDSDISGLDTRLTTAETNISSNDTDIASLQTDLATEETARIAADTTLQSNIDSEATTRAAEDTSLSAAINTEITDRISADAAQAAALTTEETARLAGDAALQTAIDNEATTRAAEDTNLHAEIDAEISARAAADVTLQANIDAEEAARIAADNTLTTAISDETTARTTADTTLQANIDAEASARAIAVSALQDQIDLNDSDIAGLDTRLTTAETNISSNDTDIAALDTRLTTAETNISSNDTDISGLDTRLTTAEGDITALESSKQSVSEKGQPNGYASLDSNGTVPTSQLPESVTGALEFQGTWDASTNTPTLPDPTTVKGHYYKVSVEGTYLGEVYHVGDWALSDGVAWEHIHTQETVSDVFGREGSIVAQEGDYSAFYPLLSDLAATDANVLTNTTKLAGIEDGADVTDATNVAAAGALMSGTAGLDDLADVSTPTPSGGQVLTYNATSGQWEAAAAGAAPVDSVNGQTGAVVLDADDIDDTATTNKFTTAADISKLAGIEAGADVTDTANVVAALTAGTNVTIAGDGTISATDTNTTYTAGSGLTLAGTEFSHSDTSAAADLTASGRTYVSGLTFDTFGHVTGYTTGTETVVNTDTTYSAGAGIDLTGTTFSHSDTSTQGSVNNADGTVIQDVTLDGYGHITGLASVNLDGRYYTEAEVNSLLAGKLSTTGKAADSNLLDGVDSSQFLRSDAADTFTELTGSTVYLSNWVRTTGQTGWYSQTYAGGWYMTDTTWVRTYNNKAIYTGNTTSEAIAAAGDVVAYYSDMRLKEKTGDIENAVDKVKQLNGFYYVENEKAKELGYDNDKVQIGVSAQEVQAVIPEAVRRAPIDVETLEDGTQVSKTGEDYLTVKYERLVPLLIEAIKEQQDQIDELKQLLNNKI